MKKILPLIAVLTFFSSFCSADTFTNKKTGEKLSGYPISSCEDGKSTIFTKEKGKIDVNTSEWKTVYDTNGRNNKVVVIPLTDAIALQIVTDAIEKAITQASSEGPLFIIFEIDTPGGRTDLAQKICSAITQSPTPVYAFIKGGEKGGAISAGAALAFACNKIYMANGTIIGAAMLVTINEGKVKDAKETFGKDISEKYSSAWRGYLASLAERNGRPGLLAKAMVDKNIEVIEVSDSGKRLFIEPVNKKNGQPVVHTWNKKGSLLTLTTNEAVQSNMADKEVTSRQDILADVNAQNAEIIVNDAADKAAQEFKKATVRTNTILKDIDLKSKEIEIASSSPAALKILREVNDDFKTLAALAKKYPNLQIDIPAIEKEINSINAASKEIKIRARRHAN